MSGVANRTLCIATRLGRRPLPPRCFIPGHCAACWAAKAFFPMLLKTLSGSALHAYQVTHRTAAAAVRPPRIAEPAELFVRSHAGTGGHPAPCAARLLHQRAGLLRTHPEADVRARRW